MNPAFSIVFFTSASGAGYGLLFWLGLLGPAGVLPADPGFGMIALVVALGLVTAGLLSSTAHLSHPERAWRAFSQWRSSWLSREGALAVLTYPPALMFGIGWIAFRPTGGVMAVLGLLTAFLAASTVHATAMIYASLKPIRQWHDAWVVPGYLALGGMTGALWLDALLRLWGAPRPGATLLAAGLVVIAAGIKEGYWRSVAGTGAGSTPESATGLGGFGKVRPFEAPHTESNYLLKEMGFRIARRHARRLRLIARVAAFGAPLILVLLGLLVSGTPATATAVLAAVTASLGVLVERWLFFAEAKHTVTLYYRAEPA
jgi:DMSO reductase anchor subunit